MSKNGTISPLSAGLISFSNLSGTSTLIEYISDTDSRYPVGLLNVRNHPIVISVRGNVSTLSKQCVSIVGTRHSTAAGMQFISEIASDFAC